ncbi:MAG: hypothetical protein ACRCZU_07115, partial [Selenomonadaceae bacterium]
MNGIFRQPGIHTGEIGCNNAIGRFFFRLCRPVWRGFSAERNQAGFDLKILNILLSFCFLLAMLQFLTAGFFTGDMAKALVCMSVLLFVACDFYLANVKKMRELAILLLLA